MVCSRDEDPDALEALQAVLEHRPVFFAQDVLTNIDGELRSNSEDVAVERPDPTIPPRSRTPGRE